MNASDVYNRIAAMLFSVCPREATRITLQAEMSNSGDYLGPDVNYIAPAGTEEWADVRYIASDLHDAFLELRKLTVGEGKQPWTTCEFVIDVPTGKFSVDFGYKDLGF